MQIIKQVINPFKGFRIHIEVVPYSLDWEERFQKEAFFIKEALGSNFVDIHHIGSTAVPGLSAKPIIDILPVVKDIKKVDEVIESMASLGYEAKGEYGIAFRRYFQKGGEVRTHNVHIYEEGDPEIERYLKFRDWMRSHPLDREQYAQLKIELAKKFPNDILQYCNGKDAFVASIDKKSGFQGYRLVKALTDREWRAVYDLRNHYFFSSIEDPYTWTFTHPEHIHFLLYKNSDIIGYIHLQLWENQRGAIRIIAIAEEHQRKGWGRKLLELSEKWLCHQGFKTILVQSSPKAHPFYMSQGYQQMPFEDPAGYETDPLDIELGKLL